MVAKVDKDDRARLIKVHIARDYGSQVNHRRLPAGARIIASPPKSIADGDQVRVAAPPAVASADEGPATSRVTPVAARGAGIGADNALAAGRADGRKRNERCDPALSRKCIFQLPPDANAVRLPANALLFRDRWVQVARVGTDNRVHLDNVSIARAYGKKSRFPAGCRRTRG